MPAPLNPQEHALLPLIEQWIETQQEQLVSELADWIAIPSVSRADLAQPGAPFGPECARILQHVLALAEGAGLRTENHQGYAGSVVYGDHQRDIGLISHLDVVPAGDNWTYPPFALTRRDEYLIGRGVADNKGPAIMDLYLLKLVRDLAIPLHHNLRIVYGLAEETNMADIAWYAEHGPRHEISIVTDGRFPVNYAQKGQLTFNLEVADAGLLSGLQAGTASNSVPEFARLALTGADYPRLRDKIAALQGLAAGKVTLIDSADRLILQARGNGGHAAFPDGTLSAACVLLSALQELEILSAAEQQLASQLERLFSSAYGETAGVGIEDRESGKLTLNAGVWQRSQSGALTITCDIRYPVSYRGAQIVERLQQQLADSGIQLASQWRDVPPFFLPEEHEVIQLLQQSWNDVSGRDDRPYAMGGVTHSKVLPNAITFGPGYARDASNSADFLPPGHGLPHGADEVIHLPSLLAALPHYVIALIRLDNYLLQKRAN
ncbi:Sapep family Mn(2+)-dependent dipeptidase [Erwiniaceae bacterium BAC15a-03b]|uniref:Sapep family Mn(2+)-dependent dipeptidase n=1 Tax=Winslowiella arboricola TaxID=2978220 RepID=A0A9J6PTI6_9GAMM|nr:Sapep family Mn(2+)-dependent dipeptidase [Winslowiella arboricola]MCU5774450.1 Sapep family Mn(2+)-dependent dipeptidase [Winslowiella arboricola]MCU5778997.1 Sapep family Mn(2+)-dependent dipeptidase [Winslowiella arboricola]